jgi:hypothetical protein
MHETLGDLLDVVEASEKVVSFGHAMRARAIEQALQWAEISGAVRESDDPHAWDAAAVARRTVTSEIGALLRLPDRTAETLVANSSLLVRVLPSTLDALGKGDITLRHAERVCEHIVLIPDEARADFEATLLDYAKQHSVAQTEHRGRILRERLHPETIAERKAKCAADRSVHVDPAPDGMAWLSAYLPAEQALAIDDRLDALAAGMKTATEQRTLTQLRADAFADLLIDGTAGELGRGVRAKVLVTVPVLTLMGLEEQPGTLDGYGPIDADTARVLAANAPSFTRLLTHPETGAVLSVGRDRYSVPADLRTWLQVRDETCRHPFCRRQARKCDIDHTFGWHAGGRTDHDNLAHLCEKHHRLKHQTGWRAKQLPGGVLEWTSPSGRTYLTQPATELPDPARLS